MKNTKMEYLYRDADNYKQINEVIVSGAITDQQIDTIMNSLEDGDGHFIPEQIGLPIHRPDDKITEADHCYCELCKEDFSLTDEAPTETITVTELTTAFETAGKEGWDSAKYAPCEW